MDFGTFLIIIICVLSLVFGESPWSRRKRERKEKENDERKRMEWDEMKKNNPYLRGNYDSGAKSYR